jgi:hypothetical protein
MSKETSNAREGDSTEGCRQGVGRDPAHIAAGGGELDPIAQLAQQDIPMSPSSSDLVERLRNRVAPEIALEREAADTIQRLEAELNSKWPFREFALERRALQSTITALQSERDRLRECLGGFVKNRALITAGELQGVLDRLMDASDAALAGKDG